MHGGTIIFDFSINKFRGLYLFIIRSNELSPKWGRHLEPADMDGLEAHPTSKNGILGKLSVP